MSLSLTLSKNEKVEQQNIRKKTHKLNTLRFWIEGGIIPLYVWSVLILVRSPWFCPLELSNRTKVQKNLKWRDSKINIIYLEI